MGDEPSTLIEPTEDPGHQAPLPPNRIALVVVWCSDEPDRVGEALIPSGEWSILGRGVGAPADPHPRLDLVRVRPGRVDAAPPLTNPHLSRVQVRFRAQANEEIQFERLGRATLARDPDGRVADHGLVRPGETLQIGQQLLLLAVRRPSWLPGADLGRSLNDFPFGVPDPFGIVGESPACWALRERIAFAGRRPEHVLIVGPSGVGKELVARALHASGSTRPMVARNAATLPDGIIDAELFGNARNYPNVGLPERPGLIGQANESTLFLDEFGELPRAQQVHLLRVLDEGEYQRLGESQPRRSRFRLIAATNRPLSVLKEDVLARLPLHIKVPDLNDRREDIPLIARHIQRTLSSGPTAAPGLSMGLTRALVCHRYTTNVRELYAFLLESLSMRSSRDPDRIPPVLRREPASPGPRATASTAPADLQPRAVQAVLDRHRGSVELTWRELGLSSRYVLTRLVARHGLRAGRTWRPPAADE